jgi:predicted PurR-regulated permease PerM
MISSRLASWLIILVITLATLILAKSLLIPLVLAITIWYIINTLAETLRKLPFLKGRNGVSQVLATVAIIVFLFLAIQIIVGAVESMVADVPKYQDKFTETAGKAMALLRLDNFPSVTSIMEKINVSAYATSISGGLSSLLGNVLLILIYLVFLLIESRWLPVKFKLMFAKETQLHHAERTMDRIHSSIRTYIGIKTFTSILTGLLSWVIMALVGLDYAVFWAFLIFLLNFIPAIGAMVATLFPALFSLVQFDTYTQFFIVFFGIGALQVMIGSLLEPRMMGNTLNISPLVVILSLAVWGTIWGVTGMLLSAPITVAAIIILAEFPRTRPIAVLLSAKGEVGEKNAPRQSGTE